MEAATDGDDAAARWDVPGAVPGLQPPAPNPGLQRITNHQHQTFLAQQSLGDARQEPRCKREYLAMRTQSRRGFFGRAASTLHSREQPSPLF